MASSQPDNNLPFESKPMLKNQDLDVPGVPGANFQPDSFHGKEAGLISSTGNFMDTPDTDFEVPEIFDNSTENSPTWFPGGSFEDTFEVPEIIESTQNAYSDSYSVKFIEDDFEVPELEDIALDEMLQADEKAETGKELSSNLTTDINLRVLLITEGTYPFHFGGVSTWCHLLIRDLPEVNFTLFSIMANPQLEPQFNFLSNVVKFLPVPLWGVREVLELRPDLTLAELRQRKRSTTDSIVTSEFIPAFENFLNNVYLSDTEPERLAVYIHQMYRFFLKYDFDSTFRSMTVWNSFVRTVQANFPQAAANNGYADVDFALTDVTQGLQWLYHWFFPLANPLPEVDVAHASMAGISTMIAVIAKLEYGAAFMLTEHGIYLRERYLAEAASSSSFFLKLLSLRFARRMTDLSYALSDQISPCCDYNQRWELQNGASPERLRTIYYGADTDKFFAEGKPIGEPPVVVWVGRINPLKDIFTLLKTAAVVHEARPDIQFKLFGNPPPEDQAYYEECLVLRASLGLEEVVNFAGYTSNAAVAYNQGDVVVLSSISEGFPFATLEAMLCGKPVVATSVGGLPEQIKGCGFAVEPRNPQAMGEAILTLMNDKELCARLGQAARQKAITEFSVHQSREAHLTSYIQIAQQGRQTASAITCEDKAAEKMRPSEALALQGLFEELYSVSMSEKGKHSIAILEPPSMYTDGNEAGLSGDLNLSAGKPSNIGQDKTITTDQDEYHIAWKNKDPQNKPQPEGEESQPEWVSSSAEGIRALAEEVKHRDAHPLDYLEVAALLESLGITDDVAFRQYGAPDNFYLARAVLAQIRSGPKKIKTNLDVSNKFTRTLRNHLLGYLQGLITLFPGLVLLLIIQAYSFIGQWAGGQIVALSMGMSAGLLITNGFLQAVMRRTSISFSLGSPRAARKFLIRNLGLSCLCMLLMALLIMLATSWVGELKFEERLTFCLSFLGFSVIWLAGGALVIVQSQVWLGISLLLGLIAGLCVDRITALFSNMHLLPGTLVGFAVTMSIIILVEWRAFATSIKAAKGDRGMLPTAAFMLYEAVPFFAYGISYVVLITIPHLLGWFGKLNNGEPREWATSSLEVGLTLALLPLVLVVGYPERTLRQFWQLTLEAQKSISGLKSGEFSRMVLKFFLQQRRLYGILLTCVSIVLGLPLWFLIRSGLLEGLIGQNTDAAVILFLAALGCYFLVGMGLFNCMFCLTLVQPKFAIYSVMAGMVVMLAVGLPLSQVVDFRYCLVGFGAGAVAFYFVSSRLARRMLSMADYFYYAAV